MEHLWDDAVEDDTFIVSKVVFSFVVLNRFLDVSLSIQESLGVSCEIILSRIGHFWLLFFKLPIGPGNVFSQTLSL